MNYDRYLLIGLDSKFPKIVFNDVMIHFSRVQIHLLCKNASVARYSHSLSKDIDLMVLVAIKAK